MIGGSGERARQRLSQEDRLKYALELSERHRKWWGDDFPATDLDWPMLEYNNGIAVAVIDYKHFKADVNKTNCASFRAMSGLHHADGEQLPFLIVRYWPDIWAFKMICVNDAARDAVRRISSGRHDGTQEISLTERQYTTFMLLLRKEALHDGDRRRLSLLSDQPPPEEAAS